MKDGTVLIVDDEPTNLAYLSATLEPHYRVRAANSGERALRVAASEPRPDLILLDVVMPDLDGYGVLAGLQGDPATRDIPVVFVTAREAAADEERGLRAGAVDYVTKPIKPLVLLARVRAHLALKQARDFLTDKNAYLEAEVDRRMEENRLIQDVSIRALAHLAETRDPETGDHILRTQEYVRLLAELLQEHPRFRSLITPRFIDLVTQAAPLHDIGKVGIPDHILLKAGRLTPDEWAVMKTHAEIGARAIERAESDVDRPVDFFAVAKEVARWHHERWDGRGYPDGLEGEAIPVSARLMAVADVFDALITARVYKPAMGFDEAREVIAGERGQQFDPDIADAFLAAYDRFAAIALQHQPVPGDLG